MKYAAPVRKELGVRTLFNILGPLTNPAGAKNQVMGVFHPDLVGIRSACCSAGIEARDDGVRPGRPGRNFDFGRNHGRRAGEGEINEYLSIRPTSGSSCTTAARSR